MEKVLRSSGLTFNLALPHPPLNHITKHHIYRISEDLPPCSSASQPWIKDTAISTRINFFIRCMTNYFSSSCFFIVFETELSAKQVKFLCNAAETRCQIWLPDSLLLWTSEQICLGQRRKRAVAGYSRSVSKSRSGHCVLYLIGPNSLRAARRASWDLLGLKELSDRQALLGGTCTCLDGWNLRVLQFGPLRACQRASAQPALLQKPP